MRRGRFLLLTDLATLYQVINVFEASGICKTERPISVCVLMPGLSLHLEMKQLEL